MHFRFGGAHAFIYSIHVERHRSSRFNFRLLGYSFLSRVVRLLLLLATDSARIPPFLRPHDLLPPIRLLAASHTTFKLLICNGLSCW